MTDMTPEELQRHDDQCFAMVEGFADQPAALIMAVSMRRKLLKYFDETDPKVALAIREGIPETVPEDVIRYGLRGFDAHGYATEMDDPDLTTLIIDYPPDHKNLTE